MATVMAQHDRAPEDSPIKTCEWLEKEMELALDRIRHKKNYAEKEQGLAEMGEPSHPQKQRAAPAEEEQQRRRSDRDHPAVQLSPA